MLNSARSLTQRSAYLVAAAAAIGAAGLFAAFGQSQSLPALGSLPLLHFTVLAAAFGLFLNSFLVARGVAPGSDTRITWHRIAVLVGLGAVLAIPPILIDLAIGLPEDLNLPMPDALFFYPGAALIAEVLFHLLPLVLLCLPFRGRPAPGWIILPVVMVEPIFQTVYLSGPRLLTYSVFLNVLLVSAAQLWLYRRHGFLAMIGLRWVFYLFWHILWGQGRLALTFD